MPTDPADADDAARPEESAEVSRLRARIARLESDLAQTDETAGSSGRRGGWWRAPVVVVLLCLLGLCAPLAIVATWAHDEIGDTNRYVDTVAPLADDPAVQAAVSDRLTTVLLDRLDIPGLIDEAIGALTDQGARPAAAVTLRALSGPLANGIEGFVSKQVSSLVASDAFAQAWRDANREAHDQMVAVLTDKGGQAVEVQDGAVRLNLAVLIDTVKNRLVERGFTVVERLPEVNAQFTLFESRDLAKAQTGFRILSAVARALPILALVLFLAAVFASRRRRRTVVVASLVVACSMLVLGLALNVFRTVYLDAVPPDQLPSDAAGAIYDQLVWFIRLNLRAVLILFLAVAAVAWVSGPGTAPSRLRSGASGAFDALRNRSDRVGLDTGPVGRFLGAYRGPIRAVVAGVVLLVYVLADHPTGAFTLTLLLVAALVLIVVELLARPPAQQPKTADEGH
jgi:hypothetical protein